MKTVEGRGGGRRPPGCNRADETQGAIAHSGQSSTRPHSQDVQPRRTVGLPARWRQSLSARSEVPPEKARLACALTTDEHHVLGVLHQLASVQLPHQCLVDLAVREVEACDRRLLEHAWRAMGVDRSETVHVAMGMELVMQACHALGVRGCGSTDFARQASPPGSLTRSCRTCARCRRCSAPESISPLHASREVMGVGGWVWCARVPRPSRNPSPPGHARSCSM